MEQIQSSFNPPFRDVAVDRSGFFSQNWTRFIRAVYDRLFPLGAEKAFTLANGQSEATDIEGLKFNPRGVTCVFFEYLIQRVTTGTGAVELTEFGQLVFVYNPTSETWTKITLSEHNPDDAGVTFSLATTNRTVQGKYQTTDITGDPLISSLFYRARTLSGKNSYYSSVGSR